MTATTQSPLDKRGSPSQKSVGRSTRADSSLIEFLSLEGELLRSDYDAELTEPQLIAIYKAMVRARVIDQKLTALQRQGRIGFHVGAVGEEAAIVASAAALRSGDWIFPCYREVGALLWRGFPLQTYINNMFGNAGDVALGRQMPDHYTSRELRYVSVSSCIGTQIPQAVGVAWAAKIRGDDAASAVFFGEGATSSNDFHAGMNLAGVRKAPVIFLCRNNQYAISVSASQQTAAEHFADKGAAYGMRSARCDGNDVFAVFAVVKEALRQCASGQGPTLIELVTYRLEGHSTSDDPRVYRQEDELAKHRAHDPITRLGKYLSVRKLWTDEHDVEWRDHVEREFKECVKEAEALPKPALSTLFDDVYAAQPMHLQRQKHELEQGPRPRPAQH